MARKGAMGKEPLRGEARRAFRQDQMRNLPGPGGQPPGMSEPKPRISPPVTARPPREKAMERLSPGVYRGSEGGLVGQGGRPLNRPQPQQRPPMQPQMPNASAANAAGNIAAGYANNQNPSGNVSFDMGPPGVENGYGAGAAAWQANNPNTSPYGRSEGSPFLMDYMNQYPDDKMYRMPMNQLFQQMPQMPQPSANNNGQYRLSPGVYGNQQQAMDQYNQQMANMGIQPASQPMRRFYQ